MSYSSPLNGTSRLKGAILISVILHAVVLFGVTFKFPLSEIGTVSAPLEVVLVNSNSTPKPAKEEARAPAVLAVPGVRSKDSSDHTQSLRSVPRNEPAANIPPDTAPDIARAGPEAEPFEREAERSMAAADSDSDQSVYQAGPAVAEPQPQLQQNQNSVFNTADLVQRGLAIARVAARSDGNFEAYQQPVKRRFIGTRTRDYRFARYAEDWRLKVERIGNLNYPEAAKREQLYGSLQLTVGIRSDGSLESVDINRPSGKKILDQAAVRIVKLAGQNGFAPFPPDISRDTDILHITRTWVFTRADELTSE